MRERTSESKNRLTRMKKQAYTYENKLQRKGDSKAYESFVSEGFHFGFWTKFIAVFGDFFVRFFDFY